MWATWDIIAMVEKENHNGPPTHSVQFVWNHGCKEVSNILFVVAKSGKCSLMEAVPIVLQIAKSVCSLLPHISCDVYVCYDSLSVQGEEVLLVGDFLGGWNEPTKAVHASGPKYTVDLRLPQGK